MYIIILNANRQRTVVWEWLSKTTQKHAKNRRKTIEIRDAIECFKNGKI
jgi:hypothetical protein